MCITERTSSDISDKPAFTPPGHIKRQQCKSKEAFFFGSVFFNRFALGAFIQNFFSGGLLVHSIFRPVILHAVHASLAIG